MTPFASGRVNIQAQIKRVISRSKRQKPEGQLSTEDLDPPRSLEDRDLSFPSTPEQNLGSQNLRCESPNLKANCNTEARFLQGRLRSSKSPLSRNTIKHLSCQQPTAPPLPPRHSTHSLLASHKTSKPTKQTS